MVVLKSALKIAAAGLIAMVAPCKSVLMPSSWSDKKKDALPKCFILLANFRLSI